MGTKAELFILVECNYEYITRGKKSVTISPCLLYRSKYEFNHSRIS